MATFSSIVFFNINTAHTERMALGLFVWDETHLFFQHSKRRLKVAGEFLSAGERKLLATTVHLFESGIKRLQDESTAGRRLESAFDYLARYNDNLTGFSPPKPINMPCDLDNFQKLYATIIEPMNATAPVNESPWKTQVKRRLYPKIEQAVARDVEIGAQTLPELIAPVKVDFIGQNGALVVGHLVSFNRQSHFVEQDLIRLQALHAGIRAENREDLHFLIAQEPPANHPSHALWDAARRKSYIEWVAPNETDRIVAYVHEHGVRPFEGLSD